MLDLMIAAKSNENQLLTDFVLTSPAPIETAARMSHVFRELSTREVVRAKALMDASNHCQEMAVELLALVAAEFPDSGARNLLRSVNRRGVTMLDVLIECQQKEVSLTVGGGSN